MSVVMSAVREHPILFRGEMVRALLDGRKTQTRRVVKGEWASALVACSEPTKLAQLPTRLVQAACDCPYGAVGDRMWVRETFSINAGWEPSYFLETGERPEVWYWADGNPEDGDWTRPKPSIFMPRRCSRLTLELTDVRVERVQDISEEDAIAEGCGPAIDLMAALKNSLTGTSEPVHTSRGAYRELWDSLNAKRGYSWDVNPWVWTLSFRRVDGGVA